MVFDTPYDAMATTTPPTVSVNRFTSNLSNSATIPSLSLITMGTTPPARHLEAPTFAHTFFGHENVGGDKLAMTPAPQRLWHQCPHVTPTNNDRQGATPHGFSYTTHAIGLLRTPLAYGHDVCGCAHGGL